MDRPPRKRVRHFTHPGQKAVENDLDVGEAGARGGDEKEVQSEAVAVAEPAPAEVPANQHSPENSPQESGADADPVPESPEGGGASSEGSETVESGGDTVWGEQIAFAITDRLDQLASMMGRVDERLESLEARAEQQQANPSSSPAHEESACTPETETDWDEAESEAEEDEPPSVDAVSQEVLQSLLYETELLKEQLDSLVGDNHELRQQNEDLAAQLAQSSVRQTVQTHTGVDESLSWEERKALIFKQMEDDSFDASSFIDSMSDSARAVVDSSCPETQGCEDPVRFVESLVEQVQRAEEDVRRREDEIQELRMLLQQKSETQQSGVVMGAAAIAGMVDSDDLVQQERERLHELKTEWEEKFRQAEIAASLERAKLSRERQQLARKAAELEDQLTDLQRERRALKEPESGGRRWLAELGLNSDKD